MAVYIFSQTLSDKLFEWTLLSKQFKNSQRSLPWITVKSSIKPPGGLLDGGGAYFKLHIFDEIHNQIFHNLLLYQ